MQLRLTDRALEADLLDEVLDKRVEHGQGDGLGPSSGVPSSGTLSTSTGNYWSQEPEQDRVVIAEDERVGGWRDVMASWQSRTRFSPFKRDRREA